LVESIKISNRNNTRDNVLPVRLSERGNCSLNSWSRERASGKQVVAKT
jgi:hypothetical protein